jgi:retrotransposon-encoded endonuclease
MNRLRILQYNVQKSKDGALAQLIGGPYEPYDIIAIQEPYLNPYIDTTYCPRSCPYLLFFPKGGRARTCLYINKKIPLSQWCAGGAPDYSWVQIETTRGLVTIHNIYSENPGSYRTRQWNTPIPEALTALQDPGQHLIVGDFNLHHPLWGGPEVRRAHTGAELIIQGAIENSLEFLLQPGTITRAKNAEQSTLDLALCTQGLSSFIAHCRITDDYSGSDHLPIETLL